MEPICFTYNFSTPTFRVPYGSNLGPLLFVLPISDLADSFYYPQLFDADDLKMYYKKENDQDCIILQHNLDSIFNLSKCCVLTFSRKWILFNSIMA